MNNSSEKFIEQNREIIEENRKERRKEGYKEFPCPNCKKMVFGFQANYKMSEPINCCYCVDYERIYKTTR